VAKYAVGYVIALLIAGVVLLLSWAGPLIFFGGPEVVRGPMIPLPAPAPAPIPVDEEFQVPSLDLTVVSAEGRVVVAPQSYCFAGDQFEECAESQSFPDSETLVVSDQAQPIELSIPILWRASVEVEPLDQDCGTTVRDLGETTDVSLTDIGPIGHYRVTVDATGPNGNATWVLRVDNQSDRTSANGFDC
jgi:hypothetical protein